MGVTNPGGSVSLPLHVAAGGTLADMLTAGNMTIGGGAGLTNLGLQATNLVSIGAAGDDTWLSRQGANRLMTSRLMNTAADEAAAATAGAGAAPPATVQGYKIIKDSGGVDRKIPYYAV